MEIKSFKENTENKEISIETYKKPKNQILEIPKDYDDDFDKKIDSAKEKGIDKNDKNPNVDLFQKFLETENLAKTLTVIGLSMDLINGIAEVKEMPNEYEDLFDTVLEVNAEESIQKTVYELITDMGYESKTERSLEDNIVDASQLIAKVGNNEEEALGMIFEEKNEKIKETEEETKWVDDFNNVSEEI